MMRNWSGVFQKRRILHRTKKLRTLELEKIQSSQERNLQR